MNQPPPGWGPQQQGPSYGQQGYPVQGYGQQPRPPRRGMSPWVIILCVVFGIPVLGFAGCFVCAGIAAVSAVGRVTAAASSTPAGPLPVSTAPSVQPFPTTTSTIDPKSCPRGRVMLDVDRKVAVQCTGSDTHKDAAGWLVTLGKIVRSPLAVKPSKIEPDSANNATDYEYSIPPFSQVTLAVYRDGPNRWELSMTSSESPAEAMAPSSGVEHLCDIAGVPPFAWLELHGGPFDGAFVMAASADQTGNYSTSVTSAAEMQADKVREEAEGAPSASSIRERLCAGHG